MFFAVTDLEEKCRQHCKNLLFSDVVRKTHLHVDGQLKQVVLLALLRGPTTSSDALLSFAADCHPVDHVVMPGQLLEVGLPLPAGGPAHGVVLQQRQALTRQYQGPPLPVPTCYKSAP